jgi:hypothetical protein
MNRFFLLIILGAVLLAVACGGGGGGSGPSLSAVYQDPASGNIILVENVASSSGSTLVLDMRVSGTTFPDVYGAAFDLCYDETVLEYQGADGTGSALCADGNCPSPSAVDTTVTGKVIVGITRNNPAAGGVTLADGDLILKLTFKGIKEGDGGLDFICLPSDDGLQDSSDNPITIPAPDFQAGTATVI